MLPLFFCTKLLNTWNFSTIHLVFCVKILNNDIKDFKYNILEARMADIKIIPIGMRNIYSNISQTYIFTHTVDVYYCDEPYSMRIGYVYKEESGAKKYIIDKKYSHMLDEIKAELTRVLGPNKVWPSAVHYPILVTRSTQTELPAANLSTDIETRANLALS